MKYFKVVPSLHIDEENDIVTFYVIKRLRFFICMPYYSKCVFNNSSEYCRLQYSSEAKEIIESLEYSNNNWFKKIIKRWL